MANPRIGYSSNKDNLFVDYTPTASTQASGFPDDNLKIYGHTKKHWRSTVITETTVVNNFGSAKAIIGVVLYDANFTNVYIQGNATDVWTSPSFSQQFTITKDADTQRYDLFAALIAFNYQYMRILIPAQTPIDNAAYFRMGTLVALDTIQTLSINPAYGGEESADEKMRTNEFESGSSEDILLGDLLWQKRLKWNAYDINYRSEIQLLNSLKKNAFLVYYKNLGDTSQVYICKRRSVIEKAWAGPKHDKIDDIILREVG